MRSGDGFFIVYSINSRESFNEASAIYDLVQNLAQSENTAAVSEKGDSNLVSLLFSLEFNFICDYNNSVGYFLVSVPVI